MSALDDRINESILANSSDIIDVCLQFDSKVNITSDAPQEELDDDRDKQTSQVDTVQAICGLKDKLHSAEQRCNILTEQLKAMTDQKEAFEVAVIHLRQKEKQSAKKVQELIDENESMAEQLATYEELVRGLTELVPITQPTRAAQNTIHETIQSDHCPAEWDALRHELSDTQDELVTAKAELEKLRPNPIICDVPSPSPPQTLPPTPPQTLQPTSPLIPPTPALSPTQHTLHTQLHSPDSIPLDRAELLLALSAIMGPLPEDEQRFVQYHDRAVHQLRALCDASLGDLHLPVSGVKASLSAEEMETARYGFVIEDEVAVWVAKQF